jgi:hypothetical protein
MGKRSWWSDWSADWTNKDSWFDLRGNVAMVWNTPASCTEANEWSYISTSSYAFVVCTGTTLLFYVSEVRKWLSSLLKIRLCGFIAVTKTWVVYASMHKAVV